MTSPRQGPARDQLLGDPPSSADRATPSPSFPAAGEPARSRKIAARAPRQRIPINVVDRPELSTFIFSAIVDRGEVVVAIGTGGASPVLAQRLRETIEALLPTRIGDLAALIGRHRSRFASGSRARCRRAASGEQRDQRARSASGECSPGVPARPSAELVSRDRRALAAIAGGDRSKTETVFLVGAGPGDPDLLTLRALHALADADVVFYDESRRPLGVLDRARRDAEQVFVGKAARRARHRTG